MDNKSVQLLPTPRFLKFTESLFHLNDNALIVIDHIDPQSLVFSANQLQYYLKEHLGVQWEVISGKMVPSEQIGIVLSIVPDSTKHPQGYEITITTELIFVLGSTSQGIFYAIQTIKQLLTLFGRDLPALRIVDWPDFPNRGVMLDISRDKVPTMETLYNLVDILSAWKINQLQLYTEHTFAYRNHPVVWAEASPMTGEEILELDAFCRERFIELVPNQNSFGHMRRWLIHEEYRQLAECPEGCETEWGYFKEPFTLYPGDPESFELVYQMYNELLPHFSSRQFNVGCDETVDLGQGRSKELAGKIGPGQIYLDFLMKIYRDLKARGLIMQFWGDIVVYHPELISKLPRDVIALEWGYEADHPFNSHGKLFAESGIPFYVCPGTSSWNTVGGRTQEAMGNLSNAAENGLRYGAIGYLITDWGDNGHWQPLPVSYLGFAYGAGVSWAFDANRDLDMSEILNMYAFRDKAGLLGKVAIELGRVHVNIDLKTPNSTILFRILQASREEIIRAGKEVIDLDVQLNMVIRALK